MTSLDGGDMIAQVPRFTGFLNAFTSVALPGIQPRVEAMVMKIATTPSSPEEIRSMIQTGGWKGVTSGLAPGRVQANLAILPRKPGLRLPCFSASAIPSPAPFWKSWMPAGSSRTRWLRGPTCAPTSQAIVSSGNGQIIGEESDILSLWNDELVSFLLGCSFSFEWGLMNAGIPLRHVEQGKNVSMYVTNIPTIPAGIFSGPMVVSMRPIHQSQVVRAVQVTSRFPSVHGAPVHIGDPSAIGLIDINRPEYGDPTEIRNDEVPVFWACGVTSQEVALQSKPPLMITHSPGHMFITDLRDEELAVF